MIYSTNNSILTMPVNKEKCTINDGRLFIEPNLLPTVCPTCGNEGTVKQILRIKAPYDWKFWIAIGGFLGGPILFGLCAVIISLAFGDKALQEFLPYGVGIAIFLAAFGGLRMSGSNRENWFLTFYFCSQCELQYKKLTFIVRLFGAGTIILLLTMLAAAVIQPALHISEQSLQTIAWVMLIAAILLLLSFIFQRVQRSIFRGLNAQWVARKPALKIKNPHAMEVIKAKVPVEESKSTVIG